MALRAAGLRSHRMQVLNGRTDRARNALSRFIQSAGIGAVSSCFAWAALLVALICLYQRLGDSNPVALSIWISSDTLYPVNVFTDVFRDHYSLSGWRFSIAPCWFPDLSLTGLLWFVLRNPILATLLAGFFQIVLLVGSVYCIARAIGRPLTILQQSLLLLAAVLVTLYVATHTGATYPLLYQIFLPQTHIGSMLLTLYGWALALAMVSSGLRATRVSPVLVIAYATLCAAAGMSNALFFTQMLAPFTAAALCFAWMRLARFGGVYLPIALGWPAAAAGAVLNRFLFHAAPVGLQSKPSLANVRIAARVFSEGFGAMLQRADPVHLFALLWLAACLAYVVHIRRRRARDLQTTEVLTGLFLLTCFLSAIFSVIAIVAGCSNGLVVFRSYRWSMHYLHAFFIAPLFGLPVLLGGMAVRLAHRRARLIALAVASGMLAVSGLALARTPAPGTPVSEYEPPLVRFLDKAAARYPIH